MYRIGIDLGGTSIKAGIVDNTYHILLEENVPTDTDGGAEKIIETISQIAESLIAGIGCRPEEVLGMGIGIPGVVDCRMGKVLYANNVCWENIPFLAVLKNYSNLPACIANDAQCAVLGEMAAGAGAGCQDLVMLTLGTGVGSGIIVNGKIFEGGGGGGIAGHNIIVRNGEHCTCGRRGCVEAYASATALVRRTKQLVHSSPVLFRLCGGDENRVTGKTAFDAAKQGDPGSMDLIEDYIACIGESIVNLVNVFRPQKVILGGGICNQGDFLLKPVNDFVQENCFAGKYLPIPKVERAKLGAQAGLIGAAALVGEDIKS